MSPAAPGSQSDIDRLLVEHLPGLRAYVRLRSGPAIRDRESSSDLVQSVCAELLNERSRFEFQGEASFRRWLYRAAEHKLIERVRYWRSKKRDLDREVHGDAHTMLLEGYATLFTPSRHASAREEIDRFEQAFDALPESYRQVIVQSRFLGLSHEAIATQEGRTPGAVRTSLCRALARLSELVAASE